jgi:hypothetical protein
MFWQEDVIDEEEFYELLQGNGDSDISESEYSSDTEINVNISSGGEQSRQYQHQQ